jgi:hypothetical protein
MLRRGAAAAQDELWACTGSDCLKPAEPNAYLQDAWAPLDRALPVGRSIAENPLSAILWLASPPDKATAAAELGAQIWSFVEFSAEGRRPPDVTPYEAPYPRGPIEQFVPTPVPHVIPAPVLR